VFALLSILLFRDLLTWFVFVDLRFRASIECTHCEMHGTIVIDPDAEAMATPIQYPRGCMAIRFSSCRAARFHVGRQPTITARRASFEGLGHPPSQTKPRWRRSIFFSNELPCIQDWQRAWVLLSLCAAPRCNNLLCLLPCSMVVQYATNPDAAMWNMFA
jgi:LSD1 subclass zinc finger protein